jgi:hypothetical protein
MWITNDNYNIYVNMNDNHIMRIQIFKSRENFTKGYPTIALFHLRVLM